MFYFFIVYWSYKDYESMGWGGFRSQPEMKMSVINAIKYIIIGIEIDIPA